MATGNVTYEQTVGLMTAMTEITRNGAKSARGLVSIQSRYNQIIDESSSTGKKLTQWYKDHNIAIKDQNGQLRSFFEVGKDVAQIWDTLSDNEKKYYLNTQAGANQSQNLAALMRNYQTAIDATATALDSAGSAAQENARYMGSMEGKLSNLKSEWEDFSRKMVDSDALKNAIDGLTKFVNFLTTDLGQTLVKTGVGLVAFGGAFKLLGGLASLVISPFRSANKVFGLFGKTTNKINKPLSGVGKNMKVVSAPTMKAATSAGKAATKFGMLASVFSGGAVGWGILGAAGVVYGLYKLNEYLTEKYDPKNQYAKVKDDISKLNKELDKVQDEEDKLRKKRDKGGLTDSEERRLKLLERQEESLKRQIELQNELERSAWAKKEQGADNGIKDTQAYKDAYNKRMQTPGMSPANADKLAKRDIGALDKLSSKTLQYKDAVEKLSTATAKQRDLQQKYNKAVEDGDDEKAAKYALDLADADKEVAKASTDLSDKFTELRKKRDEWAERFGSEDKMPEQFRESYKEANNLLKAYDDLQSTESFDKLSGKGLQKVISDFKTLGDTIGVTVDEAGNINHIDLGTFMSSMEQMGFKADETKQALALLAQENPEATITVDGTDVALKDVNSLDAVLAEFNGETITPAIKLKGGKKVEKESGEIEDSLTEIEDLRIFPKVNLKGGKKAEEEAANVEESMDELDGKDADVQVNETGATEASGEVHGLMDIISALFGKNVSVTQTGASEATGQVGGLESEIAGLSGNTVDVQEKGAAPSTGRVSALNSAIGAMKSRTVSETAKTSGTGSVAALVGYQNSLYSKTVTYTVKTKKVNEAHGTKHAPNSLAQVNEYGYEYIRDAKTGALRVANKGRRGLTMLNEGDIVYTHGESMRMRQAQEEEIPKYAKGKKLSSKKKKELKKAKDSYKKHIERIRGQYDSRIDDLEHQQAMEHHSDTWMGSQMQKAWDKYNKKLKKYNKSKSVKKWLNKWKKYGFKTTGSLGKQRRYDKDETKEDARYDVQAGNLEREIENLGFSLEDRYLDRGEVQAEEDKLNKLRKKHKLSAEDYNEYIDTIYHNYVESQMKMYEAGEKTAEDMKAVLKEQAEDGKITWNEYYDYVDEINEREKEKEEERLEELKDAQIKAIEKEIEYYHLRDKTIEASIDEIHKLAQAGNLTAEEEKEYIDEVQRKYLDQYTTMYNQGKKTYAELLALVKKYYDEQILTSEEYYDKLDELASNQLAKEQDALSKRQDQANNENSLARAWIQRKISDLEKQNEEQEKQNELIEKQMDLEKAKAKRVRVYREGVGFVYEQDTEAIKEATKALQDYKNQQEDPAITELKNILAMFDDADELANIKNLENLTGLVANVDFGKFGTNQSMWANWIQGNLSTSKGIGLLLNKLGDMEDPDKILALLGASGNISESLVNEYINKSRYASGALRTKAGFARVGEQGYEIALFGAGDSVIPHNLSKNLMEWGQMSPLEYAQVGGVGGDMYNYSFDKLVLPNVHNANDFMRELKNLPNRALQFSGGRA